MTLDIQVDYPGTCEAAFRLYEECLGGHVSVMLPYRETPSASQPPEFADKIAHATLLLGPFTLAGVDVPPARYKPPQGFTVLLNLDDESNARRIFATLSSGGHILVPLQPTFWAELYAVFTDRFGTPWKVNYSGSRQQEPGRFHQKSLDSAGISRG